MHFPDVVTDEDLRSALDAVTHWLLKEVDGLFGFIADMRRPLGLSARQRSMLAEAEKTYKHVDRAFNAAQAVVVQSTLMRGVLTAIYWISPPVYPVKVSATLDDAYGWLDVHMKLAVEQYPHGPIWAKRA